MSTATKTADGPHIDRESLKLLVRPVTAPNGWRAGEQYLAAHRTAGV